MFAMASAVPGTQLYRAFNGGHEGHEGGRRARRRTKGTKGGGDYMYKTNSANQGEEERNNDEDEKDDWKMTSVWIGLLCKVSL
jgi:hypothetical protein